MSDGVESGSESESDECLMRCKSCRMYARGRAICADDDERRADRRRAASSRRRSAVLVPTVAYSVIYGVNTDDELAAYTTGTMYSFPRIHVST